MNSECIRNTTKNAALNKPCTPNQSFIIAFLDYMNDNNKYHWNTSFKNLDMAQIAKIESTCKKIHPDINTMIASANKVLGIAT